MYIWLSTAGFVNVGNGCGRKDGDRDGLGDCCFPFTAREVGRALSICKRDRIIISSTNIIAGVGG